MRRRLTPILGLVAAALVVATFVFGSSGGSEPAASVAPKAVVTKTVKDEIPARNPRARAVEPVAGEAAEYADLPTEEPGDQPSPSGGSSPLPKSPKGLGPSKDAGISGAEVLKNGIALPPIEAPEEVRQIIQAGNSIARTPYLWGGGHGKWLDKGYDCSGSVSYALASAGLLGGPLDSGRLMGWGKPGKGKWITIYSNPGHVYMVVAGVRFDTSGTRSTGSRWQAQLRPTGGYAVRHPPGL